MKKTVLTILIIQLSALALLAQQKTVELSGRLIGFNNQVQVEDLSEFQYLDLPGTDKMIIPDSAGNFKISFKLSAPNYFRVGRNILFLSPGDKMEVLIDKASPAKGSFKGTSEAANIYLENTPFPKGGSFLEAGKNLKATPKETLDAILAIAAARKQQLEALTQISAEFKRLEMSRVKADVLCSFNAVNAYGHMSKKITSADEYIKSFNELAEPAKKEYQAGFIDPSLLKLVVYRDVAEDLIEKAPLTANVQKIKDWFKASDLVEKMNHESDKAKLSAYHIRVDSVQTIAYRDAVKKHLESLTQFGKGDAAKDFTAFDLNGKKIALSSLKGKVIYVDIWATWCGPCLEEMPKLQEMKLKYKDNPNVVFLSLSIDDDAQISNWKANVAARKADGYQWQIDRSRLSAYNITGIPRTLLIDKNFKVISMNAPLPSSKNLSGDIDKLLE